MFAYLEILRPFNGLMSAFAVIISAIIVGFFNPLQIAVACLSVFLISSGGMVINDYFDCKIDRINRPKRAVTCGKISRKTALNYSLGLFLIGILLAFFLNFYMFALAIFNSILLLIYSWKIKKTILIGNFFVSWLAASSFLFGSLLQGKITPLILILFLMAFSSSIGREIAKSIEDVKGDKKMKLKTLPIIAGNIFSAWIACIFIIFAIIFTFLPYVFNLLNIAYLYIVLIGDAIALFSCFIIFISPKRSQQMIKTAMLIVLIAFLIGTF
jgi:geranylgeranylglycerol-phosphate geranylgeranyltransferase